MASLTSTDTHKNDFTEKHGTTGDKDGAVAFTMERCNGEVVSNLGVVAIFPNDSLAVGFIYDWKLILATHGVGKYRIIRASTIAGINSTITVGSYELKHFNRQNSKETVRIYSEFNSYYLKENIDFTDSNVKDTLRFNGRFGEKQYNMEINNLIDKGRVAVKVTRENLNDYMLFTDPISIGMTSQLDKHFIKEDVTRISDYNRFSHDHEIFDKECVLIDTPKIEPIEKDRRVEIIAKFGDRKMDDKSHYRG